MAWIRQKSEKAPPRPTASPAAPTSRSSGPTFHRENSEMDKLINIGKSVQIKGELIGKEDLTIEGKLDGKILLKDHSLTIGANGHVAAEVHAKVVIVVGEVVGNITADDKVEIAATGSMHGDICAPRVVLADGARFKGSIDMEPKAAASTAASPPLAASLGKSSAGSSPTASELPRSASAAKG